MESKFKDKVVLITGAGSGIGRATAIKLASLSATLALCDNNYDALESTKRLCVVTAPIQIEDVDVSDAKEVASFIEGIVKKLGAIHHVFNCAGINPTSIPIEDTTDEYWDKLMNTNLKGVFHVTRAVVPHLQDGASFVNVSSICGLRPVPQMSVYCATKYALIGFSKSMALELAPRGIRTNVICPGYIDTPTNAGIVEGGDAIQRMKNGSALGRLGTPEEIADVVAFLFSHESRYMNGAVVEVDGGTKWASS